MKIKLRDYQEQILKELECLTSVGLFMKTGSGKTITALAKAEQNKTKNLLVVCPQKIVTQWFEVIESVTDLKPLCYTMSWTSKKKNDLIEDYLGKDKDSSKVVVVNFDIINKMTWTDNINEDWTVIIDESHKFKNMYKLDKRNNVKGGHTTKAILDLGKKTQYKIILTATPTEKKEGGYIDLYTQLTFLGYLDMNYTTFMNRYCYVEKQQLPGMPFPIKKVCGYRKNYIDKDIRPILENTCKYFAPKYGDYEPEHIKVKIDRSKGYTKLIKDKVYEDITLDNVSAARIARKTLCSGIISGTDEYGERLQYKDNDLKATWLEEFLSNTDDVVAITYCYNVEKEIIKEVCDKLNKKYIVIDGSVKDKPAEIKKEFDVVIGQYMAFGESIDGLQHKCNNMVMYSLPESSVQYKQTLGRIDRVGQQFKPVYYYLVMNRTIDENIYDNIENKVEFSEEDLERLTIKGDV